MRDTPVLSVIIPAYNARATLAQCLKAVFTSDCSDYEVIVVDDGSSDGSLAAVNGFPCRSVRLDQNLGAAAARNRGAQVSSGRILFFLDADILVEKDTLRQVVESFDGRPQIGALFCSYQKNTVPGNFTSNYKNLFHHYTHQHSREDAATFCGGFGAIRRSVFFEFGGFDAKHRNLEDIEFGYRLHRGGCKIYLNKGIQVTHCKEYSLWSLVASDFYGRAVPWTRLMLANRIFRSDLNTQRHNVLSVVVVFLTLLVLPLLLVSAWAGVALPVLAVGFLWLNRKFLGFVHRERGAAFTLKAAALCWFGYLYSGVGLLVGVLQHIRSAAFGHPAGTVPVQPARSLSELAIAPADKPA
jgi:glycosyltransferase involved in cell wall biosynthesis